MIKNNPYLTAAILFFHIFYCAAASYTSTLNDQENLELTIYNSNVGLVKDIRSIPLTKGLSKLHFMDVAESIIPESIIIRNLTPEAKYSIIEQNYEYDLINRKRLLDKFTGKEITLKSKKNSTEKKAKLISNNDGPIFEIDGMIHLDNKDHIILPEIPETLKASPTLTWLIHAEQGSRASVEASYLTKKISWKADYVLTLNEQNEQADLTGWVTIDNQSGATYKNARLKLIAGDIHQPEAEEFKTDSIIWGLEGRNLDTKLQFKEESFFEYHLYNLNRTATIKDRQQKQIQLLQGNNITAKKVYRLIDSTAVSPKYTYPITYILIKNEKENHLGIPLPEGTIRSYLNDSHNKLQFIGEKRIKHTPKDEVIELFQGTAYDISCRKVMKKEAFLRKTKHYDVELTIHNHKNVHVEIQYLLNLNGTFKIKQNSHEYRKKSANQIEFTIPVKSNEKTIVTYQIIQSN